MDNETCVETLKIAVRSFVKERSWQKYHTPKNIAESICIEAAELLQLFQWRTAKESEEMKKDKAKVQNIREELSDVVIYCLNMANSINIDLSDSIMEKLKLNESKYPSDLYRGKAQLGS